jgi:hypothetical protein
MPKLSPLALNVQANYKKPDTSTGTFFVTSFGHIDVDAAGTVLVDGSPTLVQFSFSGGMFDGARTRGPVGVGSGVLETVNALALYDDFWQYSYDGQIVFPTVSSMAETDVDVPESPDVATGTRFGYPTYIEAGRVDLVSLQLFLRGGPYALRNNILVTRYAGTNLLPSGIEGTDDIGGQVKPRIVGKVFNFSPPCVNVSKLIYQVDGQKGLTAALWEVQPYDMRVALSFGGTYASQADMEANAPLPGQYKVWVAGGCFRLGSQPVGRVTCDVVNGVTNTWTFTPAMVTGYEAHAVVLQLAMDSGDPNLLGGGGVVVSTNTYHPNVGLALTDETTSMTAVNRVLPAMGSSISVWSSLRLAQLSAAALSGSAWDIEFTDSDIHDLRVVQSEDDDQGLPVWRVTVRYARNYTVMSRDEVAGSVSEADIAFVTREYRDAVASDATVKTLWPNAREIVVDTPIVLKADADLEAARLLNLYKVRRIMLEIDVPIVYWLDPTYARDSTGTGDTSVTPSAICKVTHSRFGLSAGRLFMIIGRAVDFRAGRLTLTIWG